MVTRRLRFRVSVMGMGADVRDGDIRGQARGKCQRSKCPPSISIGLGLLPMHPGASVYEGTCRQN